ncbi:heme-containing dehydratase protein [Macrophomina phaseolina]|uniref:Heme-containing dehydratase protein n=1 Tax=Macrophomina phaseolina TaxID=35725 RepID=A0ABQ8GR47_9PEZI|nr:heme-containing dehydratase protein [Macrophomina phaseolina]
MLEPAIPPHLQAPRTHPSNLPSAGFTPPTAAYVARFPESTTDLVMATVCAQSRDASATLSPSAALAPLLTFLKRGYRSPSTGDPSSTAPSCHDLISFRDAASHHTVGAIAYWPSRAAYETWASSSGFEAWWQSLDPQTEAHGWFREVFFPPVEQYETIFSDGEVAEEGGARMREGMSGPVREHVYWGSMRDRMAAAQVDGLKGEGGGGWRGPAEEHTERRRVRVEGGRNLCVIRSGQDWSATVPRERKLYLETMHPVLIKGMDFLRDDGRSIGCRSCRFVDVLDQRDQKRRTDRTFGFAFFEDMAALENWAKRHKTHLDIFGRFLQYAKELDNNISLRLFHEVLVLAPEQQLLEYVGCHPRTGLLGR